MPTGLYSKEDLTTELDFLTENLKEHPQSKGTIRNTIDKSAIVKYLSSQGINKDTIEAVKTAESKLLTAAYILAADKLEPQAKAMNALGALQRTRLGINIPLIGTGGSAVETGVKLYRQSSVPQDKTKIITSYGTPYTKVKVKIPVDDQTAKDTAKRAEKIFQAIEKQNTGHRKNAA
jgi:acetylornithine/succinyldiaminopimelate/putrescine aminotransferase